MERRSLRSKTPVSTTSGDNDEASDKNAESERSIGETSTVLRFGCPQCSDSFSSKAERSTHLLSNHRTGGMLKCDVCSEIFSRTPALERHKAIHQQPVCSICRYRVESAEALEEHIMTTHSGKGRDATKRKNGLKNDEENLKDSGSEVSRNSDNDDNDLPEPESTVPINGDITGMKTLIPRQNTQAWSIAEQATTSAQRCFDCSICGAKGHIRRYFLEIHLRRHFEEYMYACSSCDREFISAEAATKHLKRNYCRSTQDDSSMTEDQDEQDTEDEFETSPYHRTLRSSGKRLMNDQKIETTIEGSTRPPANSSDEQSDSAVHQEAAKAEEFEAKGNREGFDRKNSKAYAASMKAEPGEHNMFMCTICKEMAFRRRPELETHLRIHFNEYVSSCPKCGERYYSTTMQKNHGKRCGSKANRNKEIIVGTEDNLKSNDSSDNNSSEASESESEIPVRNLRSRSKSLTSQETGQSNDINHFKCKHCPKKFRMRVALQLHERQHTLGAYKCRDCCKEYSTKSELARHRRDNCRRLKNNVSSSATLNPVNKGNSIQKTLTAYFGSKSVLRSKTSYQRSLPPKLIFRSLKCRYCREMISPDQRVKHIRQHKTAGDMFECEHCERKYADEISRDGHELAHLGRAPTCHCGKIYSSQRGLNRHRRLGCRVSMPNRNFLGSSEHPAAVSERETNTSEKLSWGSEVEDSTTADFKVPSFLKEKPSSSNKSRSQTSNAKFNCSYCSKVFTTSCVRRYHENMHKGEKPYKCEVCGKCFHASGNRQEHRRNVHKLRGPVTAANCNPKIWPNVPSLQTKENTVLRYACDHCEKIFHDQAVRGQHMEEQKLKCEGCNKIFCSRESFQKHMNEEQCDNSFAVSANANRFKCGFCKQSFSTAAKKKYHENRHKGIKPYKCDACSRKFHGPTARQHHRHSVHNLRGFVTDPRCNPEDYIGNAMERNKAGDKFRCQFCEKQLNSSAALRIHERLHTGEKPYKCRECDSRFFQSTYAIRHMRVNHGLIATAFKEPSKQNTPKPRPLLQETYKCQHCSEEFLEDQILEQHVMSVHIEKRPFLCRSCQRGFFFEINFEKHVKNQLCSASKFREVVYRPSQPEKMPERLEDVFECCYCSKLFTDKNRLATHEKRHEPSLICKICKARFLTEDQYLAHAEMHLGKGKNVSAKLKSVILYPCTHCEKAFEEENVLAAHVKSIHVEQRPFHCENCERGFYSEVAYERHVKNLLCRAKDEATETDQQPELPKNPAKQVSSTTSSERMMVSSTLKKISKDIVHKCGYCNRVFKDQWQKKYHENRHRGIKPYKCDACEKRFYSPTLRLYHRKMDHGLKGAVTAPGCNPQVPGQQRTTSTWQKVDGLYKCNFCEKLSRTWGGATTHERLHTGERPYQCLACDSRFVQSSHAKRHMRVHHGILRAKAVLVRNGSARAIEPPDRTEPDPIVEMEQVFRCEQCEDEFTEYEVYERHVKVVHVEKRPYHCQLCQRGFYSATNFEKHTRNRLCAGHFSLVKTRERSHKVQEKLRDELHECCYCSQQCSSKWNLSIHEKRHTEEKVALSCDVCQMTFTTKSAYRKHMKMNHGLQVDNENKRPTITATRTSGKDDGRISGYQCSRCTKAFAEESLLSAHVQNVHIEQRPFHCQVCQRGFFSEEAYSRHIEHQLCRSAESTAVMKTTTEDDTENAKVDKTPKLDLKSQHRKYPWILEVMNGPYCYECKECDTKFTREIIAEAHKQWHRDVNRNCFSKY